MSPDATGNPFIGKQTLTNLLDTQFEKISLADLLLMYRYFVGFRSSRGVE